MIKRETYRRQWQDTFIKWYPEFINTEAHAVKTITFVVTEACNYGCTYCVSGDSLVYNDKFEGVPIKDIKIGDVISGFDEIEAPYKHKKVRLSTVTQTYKRKDKTIKITLENGMSLQVTKGHPILAARGNNKFCWRPAGNYKIGQKIKTLEIPNYEKANTYSRDYKAGYIISMMMGDGLCKKYDKNVKGEFSGCQVRLAVKDTEIIDRFEDYLNEFNIKMTRRPFKISTKYNLIVDALYGNNFDTYSKFIMLKDEYFQKCNSRDYLCGYLAGIYDAEGNIGKKNSIIRICNTDINIINEIERALVCIDIPFIREEDLKGTVNFEKKWNIRVLSPRCSHMDIKFLKTISSAVLRKNEEAFFNRNIMQNIKIVNIEESDEIDVYNLETTTHTYFANGFAVHNCYEHNKDHTSYMSKETAKKAIDTILNDEMMGGYIDSSKSPGVIIEFMGGEPLLNIDIMHYIADYFLLRSYELKHPFSKYHMFNFTTNGSLFFDPRVQDFLKKFGATTSFTITLDGNKELHDSCRIYRDDGRGTYDDTIKAVLHAKEHYNMNTSKVTLAPENLQYMNDALKHFIDLGITSLHANPVYEPVWNINHARLYYKELMKLADFFIDNKLYQTHTCSLFDENIGHPQGIENNQNYCGGNGNMLAIGTDGKFYPCVRFMPYSIGCKRPPLVVGDIWNGIKPVEDNPCVKCLWDVTRRSQCTGESEKCFDCPVSSGCGECNGLVYELTGTPNYKLRGICEMHKARTLANHYYWNRLYKIEGENREYKLTLPEEDIKNLTDYEEII